MGATYRTGITALRCIATGFLLVNLNTPSAVFAAGARAGADWMDSPETTYEKFLSLALKGDAEIQNVIGYMHYFGEGVVQDYEQAYNWFRSAAEQGNVEAQRNIAIFHSGALLDVPGKYVRPDEAMKWVLRAEQIKKNSAISSVVGVEKDLTDINIDLKTGEIVYLDFCAACHGNDGIATHEGVPSLRPGNTQSETSTISLVGIPGENINLATWHDVLDKDLLESSLLYARTRFSAAITRFNLPRKTDREETEADFSVQTGEKLFVKFCAGCHGFNGIAYYVNSPSFALGERLHKDDNELERSITNGLLSMPPWGDKLSVSQIRSIIKFIRVLPTVLKMGIAGNLRNKPDFYFRFRPLGETNDEWMGTDPVGSSPEQ